MNYYEEFLRLKSEHDNKQEKLRLNSPDEVLDHLRPMTILEDFFREHCSDPHDSNTFWNFSSLYEENRAFARGLANSSVSVARHLRYDPQKKHKLNFFNFVISYEGETELHFSESSQILRSGDVVIIAPDTVHALRSYTDDAVLIKYYIRKSTFERIFSEWLNAENPLSDFFRHSLYNKKNDGYTKFNTFGDIEFRNLALMIYAEIINHRAYYNMISEAKMTELICRLMRDHLDSISNAYFSDRKLNLSKVVADVQTNYATASLEKEANIAGYSKNHLCRIFHSTFNISFNEFLNRTRIEKATNLIISTDMTIQLISERVGYNSVEHFHRVFKELKGISPLKYREQYKEQEL